MILNVILFLANFIRTLLVIVIAYYLIRFIAKVVMPIFNPPQQRNNFQQQHRRREGDVTVEDSRRKGSRFSKEDGEYVDFEEID